MVSAQPCVGKLGISLVLLNFCIVNEAGEDEEGEVSTASLVKRFFKEEMKIADDITIVEATRIGNADSKTILVKLQDVKDKGVIFKNERNLKDLRNSKGKLYYINNQLTQANQEKECKYRKIIRHNASLAGMGKRNMVLKKGNLLIDGQVFREPVVPPGIAEVVYPCDQKHVDRMSVHAGDIQCKDICKFQGYCVEAVSLADVRATYTKICRLHLSALHIACAYRLPGPDHANLCGYEDDGEHGAERTIHQVLEDKNVFNKAIYVVRDYGNRHLGKIRFQMFSAAAKTALIKHAVNQDHKKSRIHNSVGPAPQNAGGKSLNLAGGSSIPANVVGKAMRDHAYITATSPHPFHQNPSWGNVESRNTNLTDEAECSPRERAKSWCSATSGTSFISAANP